MQQPIEPNRNKRLLHTGARILRDFESWLNHERKRLGAEKFDAPVHLRILAIGGKTNGTTDIVACLERALRNLGHHLVFLDTKRHKQLIDNPEKHQGGNGPVYVSEVGIRQIVRRFRPQIIMTIGGGLAFREDDAELLKKSGCMLVGITLSDPDVMASMQRCAAAFDIHTTNSLLALDAYHEFGLRNTLYFPFGVDRSFVAKDVAIPDAFRADVICLGHANAHPVRDRTMREVISKIGRDARVHTYGRGWSNADSRLVEDVEVLQASRGGTVHVNFPMTRAGYVNVKCGAFETVASGGLLVTQRFKEMQQFFDYDEEIIGYDDLDQLPEVISSLLGSPERIDAMRLAAFKRLVASHLYEHRWLDLFERMAKLVQDPASPMPQERRAEIADILSSDQGHARIVAVSGFYGARNLGDDLILEAITSAIERDVPGAQPIIVAQNARVVEAQHGFQAVTRHHHKSVDALISNADAFVLGGGGLWHDYTFDEADGVAGMVTGSSISISGISAGGLLAAVRQVPFHTMGLGVGPLTKPDAFNLVRFVANQTESLSVRDKSSQALVQRSGTHKDVLLEPDVVYSLDLKYIGQSADLREMSADHLVVWVNLRPWDRALESNDRLVQKVASAIRRLANDVDRPIALALLPMQEGPSYDRRTLRQLVEMIASDVSVYDMPTPLSTENFIETVRGTDIVLSMRLHTCLLAHRLGKAVVGLAYDPKLGAHFEEVGRSEFCLQLDASEQSLGEALVAASKDTDLVRLKDNVTRLEADARQGLSRLCAAISSSDRRTVHWDVSDNLADRKSSPNAQSSASKKLRAVRDAISAGTPDVGLEILEEIRKSDPGNAEAILLMMKIHLAAGNWKKLTYYLEKAAAIPVLIEDGLRMRHAMYVQREKLRSANQLIEGLPENSPLRAELQAKTPSGKII